MADNIRKIGWRERVTDQHIAELEAGKSLVLLKENGDIHSLIGVDVNGSFHKIEQRLYLPDSPARDEHPAFYDITFMFFEKHRPPMTAREVRINNEVRAEIGLPPLPLPS